MADFTWITHTLWIYEDRKKGPKPKPEKVGVSVSADRTASGASRKGQAERAEKFSKN